MYRSLNNRVFLEEILKYIPDRTNEGYGVSMKAIDLAISKKLKLIIALDCGLKAHNQVDYAKKNKIDFQRLAASSSTGTDTDAFAYSNMGVASALISLPLRYMHTTVEMCSKDDVNSVIELIYHSLLKIKNQHDFKYIK